MITYKSSPCPDMIPSIFFLNSKFVLTIPLLYSFNLSLFTGSFPTLSKSSFITPISKGGSVTCIANYRPIYFLLYIKCLNQLYVKKLQLSSLVCDDQHGFKSFRMTTNYLVFRYPKMYARRFCTGSQVDVIYTDFSKAFDQVNYSILISKLHKTGIRNPFLSWIPSYILSNREQIVKYTNLKSDPFIVSSDVPQGSHLSPSLFLLFINDLNSYTQRKFCLLMI